MGLRIFQPHALEQALNPAQACYACQHTDKKIQDLRIRTTWDKLIITKIVK